MAPVAHLGCSSPLTPRSRGSRGSPVGWPAPLTPPANVAPVANLWAGRQAPLTPRSRGSRGSPGLAGSSDARCRGSWLERLASSDRIRRTTGLGLARDIVKQYYENTEFVALMPATFTSILTLISTDATTLEIYKKLEGHAEDDIRIEVDDAFDVIMSPCSLIYSRMRGRRLFSPLANCNPSSCRRRRR